MKWITHIHTLVNALAAANLNRSIRVWHDVIALFGDTDVVLWAVVVTCSPESCSCLPMVLTLTGWLMGGITARWIHWFSISMVSVDLQDPSRCQHHAVVISAQPVWHAIMSHFPQPYNATPLWLFQPLEIALNSSLKHTSLAMDLPRQHSADSELKARKTGWSYIVSQVPP